jgi:hypothetical protein
MRLLIVVGLCTGVACAGQGPVATLAPAVSQNQVEKKDSPEKPSITIPAGFKVVLALTSPVWSATAKAGDNVYAISAFPVSIDNQMAIPPGTYVEGRIDALMKPTHRTNSAEFQIHFTKLIFANGYTVQLLENTPAATAAVYVQVSYASDILLDNGSQIEMTLQSPLSLDAGSVAVAARRSKAPPIWPQQSATRCRPVAGTPGTSDTVIPGTPGTPGTPPTVIPGGPGMPDIVIPGTPGTPGTPPTVFPGIPGTPGYSCPGPPIVRPGPPSHQDDHVEYVTFPNSVQVGGKKLIAGTYQIAWAGLGPTVQVKINQKGNLVVSVQARVVVSEKKASRDEVATRSNADGSNSLESLRFENQTFQLFFD